MMASCDLKCYIIHVPFCIKVCIKSLKSANSWVFIFISDDGLYFITKYNPSLTRIFQIHYTCALCIKVGIKSIHGILFSFSTMTLTFVRNITKYNPSLTREFQFTTITVDITVIFLFECSYFDIKGK